MKRKYLFILGALIIVLPIAIHFLFKQDFNIKWLYAEWSAGDVLGYCGTIIGALATIIAVYITIKHTKEEQIKLLKIQFEHERKELWFNEFRRMVEDTIENFNFNVLKKIIENFNNSKNIEYIEYALAQLSALENKYTNSNPYQPYIQKLQYLLDIAPIKNRDIIHKDINVLKSELQSFQQDFINSIRVETAFFNSFNNNNGQIHNFKQAKDHILSIIDTHCSKYDTILKQQQHLIVIVSRNQIDNELYDNKP